VKRRAVKGCCRHCCCCANLTGRSREAVAANFHVVVVAAVDVDACVLVCLPVDSSRGFSTPMTEGRGWAEGLLHSGKTLQICDNTSLTHSSSPAVETNNLHHTVE
jgi:hypothetical protein